MFGSHVIAARGPLPPSRPGHPLWGVYPEYARDALGLMTRAAREQGDVARLRFGPWFTYLVSHPDDIKQVLQTRSENFPFSPWSNEAIQLAFGVSMLSMAPEAWHRRHRLLTPAFRRARVERFAEAIVETTLEMLDGWQLAPDRERPIEACTELYHLALRIASKALLGVDIGDRAKPFADSSKVLLEFVGRRMNAVAPVPLFLPTRGNRAFKDARTTIRRLAQSMLDERRRSALEDEDLIALLEAGDGISDEAIGSEIVVNLLAGSVTVAMVIPWTLHLLAEHPDEERQLRAELSKVLGTRSPTIDDLGALPRLERIVDESMRLYPVVWALDARQSVEDCEIGGYHVPAGSTVLIAPYVVHRDQRFWKDPQRFRPERFGPDRAGRNKHAYLPFGTGPRKCKGGHLAMLQARLILATLLQRSELRPKPGHRVTPQPDYFLVPKHGLPMLARAKPVERR